MGNYFLAGITGGPGGRWTPRVWGGMRSTRWYFSRTSRTGFTCGLRIFWTVLYFGTQTIICTDPIYYLPSRSPSVARKWISRRCALRRATLPTSSCWQSRRTGCITTLFWRDILSSSSGVVCIRRTEVTTTLGTLVKLTILIIARWMTLLLVRGEHLGIFCWSIFSNYNFTWRSNFTISLRKQHIG